MPVIDLTGRSLHYLYSSWLSVTPYAWQMLLNQFSNFVGCLSVTAECYDHSQEVTDRAIRTTVSNQPPS